MASAQADSDSGITARPSKRNFIVTLELLVKDEDVLRNDRVILLRSGSMSRCGTKLSYEATTPIFSAMRHGNQLLASASSCSRLKCCKPEEIASLVSIYRVQPLGPSHTYYRNVRSVICMRSGSVQRCGDTSILQVTTKGSASVPSRSRLQYCQHREHRYFADFS